MKKKNILNSVSGRGISRRNFLAGASSALAFTYLPRHVLGGKGYVAPSDRFNVAIIGTGGQGIQNIKNLLRQPDVQIPAICDVNWESDYSRFYFGGTAGRGPALKIIKDYYSSRKGSSYKGCNDYIDYREMLDKEKNNIDAVLVATPDHMHALATMAAIDLKKHVYCEKPLTHSIAEARKIAKAAHTAGVTTQMGNQGHSGEGLRLTIEWIKAGAIGPVRKVDAWTSAGGGWTKLTAPPAKHETIPNGFDWIRWLGPAKHRPYSIEYAPYTWRGWWDFGTGALGDMACHNTDPAFMALDLGDPVSVEACSTPVNKYTCSLANMVTYRFGPRGNLPPVTLTWYDGGLRPPRPIELERTRRMGSNGIIFYGDKGTIMCPGWAGPPRIIPESKMRAYKRPPKTLPRTRGHHRDWIDSAKKGVKSCADFGYSAHLTEVVLLGNVAIRTGKILYWDAKNMKATNAPEADIYINPPYYNGYKL